jgi:hypothetical protein
MDESKIMNGGAFFLGDSLVAWLSKNQGSILLHPFRHLGEKKRGACMPSWVLLSMTVVEERVRERKTKL